MDYDSFLELIKARRSIRRFKPAPIPDEYVDKIIEAARWACAVILDGRAVKSCSILALQANGKEVLTIEGLADGAELHPIQQAFIDNWAFQCGFCTSGQIMAAKALLEENPKPAREEIQLAMDGHLCRCTGYDMINEAVQDAAGRLQAQK